MENKTKTVGKTTTQCVGVTETQEATNKCKFCGRLIGDYISSYHIGCYKQMKLLDEKERELEVIKEAIRRKSKKIVEVQE